MASTAVSMVACPVMISTVNSSSRSRNRLSNCETVHARHPDIDQSQVDGLMLGTGQGRVAAGGHRYLDSGKKALQGPGKSPGQIFLVINNQYALNHHSAPTIPCIQLKSPGRNRPG
jgi:hypothetical protein